jgi:hypothetical protein
MVADPDAVPSLAQRLDPDGSLAQAEALAETLKNPLVRLMLGQTRSARKGIDDVDVTAQRMRSHLDGLNLTAELLGPLGWCTIGRMPAEVYQQATEWVAGGDSDAAEAVIVEGWNTNARLHVVRNLVKTLYPPEDPRRVHRWHAVDEAVRCHDQKLYRGSISITLAVIEGVIEDVTAQNPDVRFYRRGKADLLTDDTTLAGHPSSLPVLSRILGAPQNKTEATGQLRRNGILHGRELDFGSQLNSTKAIVALIAAIEWAQPIARQLMDEARAAWEHEHTGLDGCDDDGRRLDRREFTAAKEVLETVGLYQHGRRKRGLGYTGEFAELGIRDELAQDPRWELRVDEVTDSYWCWFPTVSGWVLGLAARAAQYPVWHFSGSTPPAGGIDGDDRWRHTVRDSAHPDW